MSHVNIKSHFDPNEIEDTSNPYPRPLFLVPLPPLECQLPLVQSDDGAPSSSSGSNAADDDAKRVDILAYGGDNGCIYLLNNNSHTSSANNNNNSNNNDNDNDNDDNLTTKSSSSNEPIIIRKYDDEVRALTVSNDGKRVAVGFDDGSTKIYCYDNFIHNVSGVVGQNNNNEEDGACGASHVHHPFIPPNALITKKGNKLGDDDDEDEDDFTQGLSQEEDDGANSSSSSNGEVIFDGPRLDASIRQMIFDPRSATTSLLPITYYLAIVSESGHAPLAICNVTNEHTCQTLYLNDKSEDEYEGCGVRSVAYTTTSSSSSSSNGNGNGNNTLLATLGMDGKVVTWDVSSTSDPSLLWDVIHKDYVPVVPKKDQGDLGGDSGDKGCRLLWDTVDIAAAAAAGEEEGKKKESKAVLFMPGHTDIQYRVCPLSKTSSSTTNGNAEALTTNECKEYLKRAPQFINDMNGNGHSDTIVAMAVQPNDDDDGDGENGGTKRLLTGGRDGKLLLWDINVEDGTGTATEIPLNRPKSAVGIPPITSIVWYKIDELYVAYADGNVVTGMGGSSEGEEVGEVEDAVNTKSSSPKKNAAIEEKSDSEEEASDDDTVALPATQDVVDKDDKFDSFSDDEDEEDLSAEKTIKKAVQVDDEEMMKEDEAAATSTSPFKKTSDKPSTASTEEKKDDDTAVFKSSKKEDASKFIDNEAEDGGDDDDDDDAVIQYDDVIEAPAKSNDADKEEENKFEADEDMFDSHNDPIEFDNTPAVTSYNTAIPLQPAFAPSSTPLTEPRRILCWNHVGVVTLRNNESEENDTSMNLVDITFHETAGLVGGRRPATFTDNMGFIVGTLGDGGAMFASDLQEEEEDDDDDDEDDEFVGLGVMSDVARKAAKSAAKKKKMGSTSSGGSNIYFYRFETFGRNADKDWVMALPDGERVLGCATGAGWGAAITSRRFLRLFTISGLQGPILWIPGAPVTIVGRGRFVAVFYHRSAVPSQDGTQLLGYTIYDGLTGATIVNGDVSGMSPGSSLNWAGFSEKFILSVMDSDGMLSMLARYPSNADASSNSSDGNWMPLLDTVGLKKSTHDTYWPVEVHGSKLVCVLLRGGNEYPDAGRRPVTTSLSLRIPLATSLTAKSGPYEELSIRAIFALNQDKVLGDYLVSAGEAFEDEIEEEYQQKCLQVDKATMKLFQVVVQAGKVERAYDLVQRLHSEKLLDIAITYADRQGQRKLSDRIEEYKLQKYPAFDDEGPFDDSTSVDSGARSERSASFDEEEKEPVVATRRERLEIERQRISPEGVYSPRHRSGHVEAEESEGKYSTDEESPPRRETLKRKFEESPLSKKRINPFAKKKLESPAKGLSHSHTPSSKLTLSRSSTFSAKSREKQRRGKQIV